MGMPSTNSLAAAAALGTLLATLLLLEQRFRGPSPGLAGQGAALCSYSPQALQAAAQSDPGSLVTSVQPPAGLEDVLRRVAPTKELLVVLSDSNMLKEAEGTPGLFYMWLQCIQRLRLTNYLVVAIDEKMRDHCHREGINYFYRKIEVPAAQASQRANQATVKFEIVLEFLALGYSVLLSDLDVVTVQNPFQHLCRDADLECMTDGSTAGEAYGQVYGVEEPDMGWSVYGEGLQHRGLNAGLFYVKANQRGLDLMARIARRVATDSGWDQRLFNEEIFFLSHGDYTAPQASVRVMEFLKYMNSKVLFGWMRFQRKVEQPEPVMVHINYHPDKPQRMKAAIEYLILGNASALKPFPDKKFKFSLQWP